jgi:hypothetical protein
MVKEIRSNNLGSIEATDEKGRKGTDLSIEGSLQFLGNGGFWRCQEQEHYTLQDKGSLPVAV